MLTRGSAAVPCTPFSWEVQAPGSVTRGGAGRSLAATGWSLLHWSAQKACRLRHQGLMLQVLPRSGRWVATLATGSQTAICILARFAVHCTRGRSGSPFLGSLHLSYHWYIYVCVTHANCSRHMTSRLQQHLLISHHVPVNPAGRHQGMWLSVSKRTFGLIVCNI